MLHAQESGDMADMRGTGTGTDQQACIGTDHLDMVTWIL
jgi:hypothetical protein